MVAVPSPSPSTQPGLASLQPVAAAATLRPLNPGAIVGIQVVMLLAYVLIALFCGFLLAYMRVNRHVAFTGDAGAARKLILPAFVPLLWILALTTTGYAAFSAVMLYFHVYATRLPRVAGEVFHSGRQFVFVLVVVLLLQKSISLPALRRSVAISVVLSTYSIPIAWVMVTYADPDGLLAYWSINLSRTVIVVLDIYVFCYPPVRASKRSIREFCGFAIMYHALLLTCNVFFRLRMAKLAFLCASLALICCAMCPLVIWRVLKADTEHWRGLGQRACALQSVFRQANGLHERISSQGLHVLIEMHRRHVIDFAVLEIRAKIGVGASSTVFNGVLQSRTPVAIKVYTPMTLTEQTVAQFSNEAALCGSLHHPNIVQFYGMCICPPSICLVSELCQGSLDHVMAAVADSTAPLGRQQILINLGYMIDAARAVAYMHSFSPAFLHRDIKPANFLLDATGTVKLTDFGESRTLHREQLQDDDSGKAFSARVRPRVPRPHTSTAGPTTADGPQMTVKGTVDYMAPELINGKGGYASYAEAADVYALAITFWDILHPGGNKYSAEHISRFRVYDAVLAGKRPQLDATLHPNLRELIAAAWHADPKRRPRAGDVVAVLAGVQEELLSAFALELSDELAQVSEPVYHVGVRYGERCFTGEQLLSVLEEWESVDSVSEGVRLGNALMDAGLLHHAKHARAFEDSEAVFFLDHARIQACQPLAIMEQADSADERRDDTATEDDDEESDSHGLDTSMLRVGKPTIQTRGSRSTTTELSMWAHNDRARGNSAYSSALDAVVSVDTCRCRLLGQRVDRARLPRGGRGRRARRQLRGVVEENLLTTKLLDPRRASHVVVEGEEEDDDDEERPAQVAIVVRSGID